MVGQQLREPTDVALVDQAAATGAQMTLALGVLVTQVMAAGRRVPLEALRCLAKTLRCGLVGFQLRHDPSLLVVARARKARRPSCFRNGLPARLLADHPGAPVTGRAGR